MANLFDLLPMRRSTREKIIFSLMPNLVMEVFDKYLRIEMDGLENLPSTGSAIITPNHSGYSGLDAMILTHEIFKKKHRVPRVLSHYLWFQTNWTTETANRLGFIEATKEKGLEELRSGNMIILFPEGERGNFKPTKYAYRVQEFRRGFVRMALATQSPIIPTIIVGAEETHINLKKITLPKAFNKLSFPIPLNVLPLPVRWKIKFLPPVYLPYTSDAQNNSDLVHDISMQIERRVQTAIDEELKERPGVFINRSYWLREFLAVFNIKS